ASGTLVAAHLLGADTVPLSVALVQADATVGEGVAYATRRPEHLLNVRAAGMSALDASPGDFVDFLLSLPAHAGADPAALGARFLPRRTYARYLAALLDARPGRGRLQQVAGPAVDVSPIDGGYLVELASGER